MYGEGQALEVQRHVHSSSLDRCLVATEETVAITASPYDKEARRATGSRILFDIALDNPHEMRKINQACTHFAVAAAADAPAVA